MCIINYKSKKEERINMRKSDEMAELFSVIDKLPEKCSLTLVIEGPSASGKTTLSEMLREKYNCTVFHMDDFFLRPEQRTPERYAEVGGNLDRERFLEDVLIPLKKGENINYRRFDCSQMKLLEPVVIKPQKLTVIEGVYSMHPAFSGYYDLSVFLDINSELQKERIMKRNTPEKAERFFNEWIPIENKYFSGTDVKSRCDFCIKIMNE